MKYLATIILLGILGFFVSGSGKCSPTPPTPVADAAPSPLPGPEDAPPGPASCATACANQVKLGCVPAATPRGASCVQVCTNADATVPWDVVGLTSATSCR